MSRENLIVVGFTVLVLIYFPQNCRSKQNLYCHLSSCGNINNISYPFRLKDDPKNCGHPKYELACEHNITVLYLGSPHKHKYYVQSINYPNFTIRLVDSDVQKKDNCSFLPRYPLTFVPKDPYSLENYKWERYPEKINLPTTLISCPYPVDSLNYKGISPCVNGVYPKNSSLSSSYVKVGPLMAVEVRERCSIEVMTMTSWPFKDDNNPSFSDIYNAMAYGFELSWFKVHCKKCDECYLTDGDKQTCPGGICSNVGILECKIC